MARPSVQVPIYFELPYKVRLLILHSSLRKLNPFFFKMYCFGSCPNVWVHFMIRQRLAMHVTSASYSLKTFR